MFALALVLGAALIIVLRTGHESPVASAAGVTSTASSSPDNPARGASVTFSASVTSDTAQSVLIDVEVYNPSGTRVYYKAWDNQALTAGQAKSVSVAWTVPSAEPTGTHTVKVGVFKPSWGLLLHWNNRADTFSVIAGSSTPAPTATPSTKFTTLPAGAALPSDSECASRVRRSSWEPRPGNATANQTMPPAGLSLPDWKSVDSRANTQIQSRITGRFTGTTDEIIQWGACKWGFDEDIVRAVATNESWWRQTGYGDQTSDAALCSSIGKTAPCYQTWGLMQIKVTVHKGTWPYASTSTAFNVDYVLALYRVCYEGYLNWLESRTPAYTKGDLWGCVGQHYSGGWYDEGANWYIPRIKNHLSKRTWAQPGF
jgi:autotransporter family porin